MKKYNKFNTNMFFMGFLIPILTFFVAMNVTFAYFTARTSSITSSETGKLVIDFTDDTKLYANSQVISTNTKLLPGDTLKASGSVENIGNTQAYVLIKLEIVVTKLNSTSSETVDELFYTVTETATTEITKENEEYSATAFVLNESDSKPFEINYVFDFEFFGNEYKDATITYNLQACAIQTIALTDADEATDLLIQR